MTISVGRCRQLAIEQGLRIYRLPGYARNGLVRRYAVGRGDRIVPPELTVYVGIYALWSALQSPEER